MTDLMRIATNVGTVTRPNGPQPPGIAFYDHVTRTECYTPTNRLYKTASVVKASILGALLQRPQELSAGERELVEKVFTDRFASTDAAGELWKILDCGKDDTGSVRPCRAMWDFWAAAGMTDTSASDTGAFGETSTTARDQVKLLKLFTGHDDGVINRERRAYALDLMKRAEPRFGVPSFAPPGTVQRLKVGYANLNDGDYAFRVHSIGQIEGGPQAYNYLMAILTDQNDEVNIPGWPYDWPYNGEQRVNDISEQLNCGVRELNGDGSCWSFKKEECSVSPPEQHCSTVHPLRSHRSQHWVRVSMPNLLGTTVHWRLKDAANGVIVDEGDAVGGPDCVCEKTVYGLYGSYILLVDRDVANPHPLGGTILNYTGDPEPGANQPPVVYAGPDVSGDEGSPIAVHGFANDDDGMPQVNWSVQPGEGVDPGGSCTVIDPSAPITQLTCNDDGTFVLTMSANDGRHGAVTDTALVHVKNVAPILGGTARAASAEDTPGIQTPRPWQAFEVGTPVQMTANFTDPGSNDTHVCAAEWDDGTSDSVTSTGHSCTITHTFDEPGMYTIKAKVTDDDGGTIDKSVLVVVYDPDGGFATSGAQLDSPVGALASAPGAGGKLSVQANPAYKPGDTGPIPGSGKVQARLDGTDFSFAATDLQWLVVAPDEQVAVKGTGTVNGEAGFGFVLYGYDDPDKLRLVVWSTTDGENPGGKVLYDNRRGADYDLDLAEPQALTGGSFQAHL
ncbi:PKD domain-containing protein [Actinomadura alba]|uniref:PKD domain-containing protein n=1 Tax=Actinomadura alba TaxID=406431 RepID=A0ABR7LNU6_9ACTN|nr:PKD domain-containing protein [Actinomadura alba]MBC6466531.1 PKD domain-containing protein [Actinomadura alba]